MHHHSGIRALSNVLALALIASGMVWGLESCGVQTGVPQLLICRVGHSLVMNLAPGLLQLLLAGGILLCLPSWTRPFGTTLLIISVAGMVIIEVWAQHASPYCGFTGGGGSTP